MKGLYLTAALFGASSTASKVYTASYAGAVTTLEFGRSDSGYELTTISNTTDCGPNPSWLMLDADKNLLVCLDEGLNGPNGTLTSFEVDSDGSLSKIHHLETVLGPVQSHLYSAGNRTFFAVAHYSGSSVTAYALNTNGVFTHRQTFTYELDGPGTDPDRQEAPHPHGVVLDPTGQFILVPDLGATSCAFSASTLRRACWNRRRLWQCLQALVPDTAYSGRPRVHVQYPTNGTISFDKFFETTTYGGPELPDGATAAEIAISPANNHIVISNREDNKFGTNNDTISVFSCADASGESFTDVTHTGLYP
ncbi:hypothetical protein ANOM_011734, partial [Aspergillus nomiae NRRL 13137]